MMSQACAWAIASVSAAAGGRRVAASLVLGDAGDLEAQQGLPIADQLARAVGDQDDLLLDGQIIEAGRRKGQRLCHSERIARSV